MHADAPPSGEGTGGRPPARRGAIIAPVVATTGTVTAIGEARPGSARYTVSIEGRPAVVLSAEAIAEVGVRLGTALDPALAARLSEAALHVAVFDRAVALLAMRGRTGRELCLRLRRAGAPPGAIDGAMARLQALGALDDEALARRVAESRLGAGAVSRRLLKAELQRRGVARAAAEAAVEAAATEVGHDEEAAARALAERRLRSLRGEDALTRRRRLQGFLARRGFASGVIARVVRALVIAADDGDAG